MWLRLYPFPPAPIAPHREKRDMAKEGQILVSPPGTVNQRAFFSRREDSTRRRFQREGGNRSRRVRQRSIKLGRNHARSTPARTRSATAIRNAIPIPRHERAVKVSGPGAGPLREDQHENHQAAQGDSAQQKCRDNRLSARKPLILFVHFHRSANSAPLERLAEHLRFI